MTLLPKIRSKAIMQAPKTLNAQCSARIGTFLMQPCSPPDTNVMHHLDGVGGRGVSTKVTDLATIIVCHNCHRLLETPSPGESDALHRFGAAVAVQLLRALVETQAQLVGAGIIEVKDGEIV